MFLIKMFIYLTNILYCIFKCRKTKSNRVLFLSRQSNIPSIDFKLLSNELLDNNYEVIIKCKKIEPGIISKIKYIFYILEIMFILPSCKLCITDGYSIPVSILNHKKDLIIVQSWHALCAIKQFGYQTLGKSNGSSLKLANTMCMHKNYSYVLCASSEMKRIYKEAFNVTNDIIKVIGMPRVDYLNHLSQNYNKDIYKDYPIMKKKKNIVYVPTFRKDKVDGYQKLIDNIDHSKYNLFIKLHPLDQNYVDPKYIISNKYNTYDLIYTADIVISDYSAIILETSILNKKMFIYCFDYDEYKANTGLNLDINDELKSSICYNVEELVKNIENDKYNFSELENFKNKYIETLDINNTNSIVEFIMEVSK